MLKATAAAACFNMASDDDFDVFESPPAGLKEPEPEVVEVEPEVVEVEPEVVEVEPPVAAVPPAPPVEPVKAPRRSTSSSVRHFHRHVFGDVMNEDGLAVLAKGLGVGKVLCKFIQVYCGNPEALVFVLNASSDAAMFKELLRLEGVPESSLPSTVDNDMPSDRRRQLYKQGGCVFITSRILIVDLLAQRLDAALITGFLIHNAHRVQAVSNEACILRCFRQVTDKGFIKAFSNDPVTLVAGFNRLERTMKALFIRKLYLWPRFHEVVRQQLSRSPLEVAELYQPMTPSMVVIHKAILSSMHACLSNLKRATRLPSMEMSLEDGLFDNFDQQLRQSLGSTWTTLPSATKQLLADLRTLRKLLMYLSSYDCVTFLTFLEVLRSSSKEQQHPSLWLFSDFGENILRAAHDRVYRVVTLKPRQEFHGVTVTGDKSDAKQRYGLEVVLEENPKLELLMEVLREIEAALGTPEVAAAEAGVGVGAAAMVLVRDERTCLQLEEYLTVDRAALLRRMFSRYVTKYVARTDRLRQLYEQQKTAQLGGAMHFSPEMRLLWKYFDEVVKAAVVAPAPDAPKTPMCPLPVVAMSDRHRFGDYQPPGAETQVYAELASAAMAAVAPGDAKRSASASKGAAAAKRLRTLDSYALSGDAPAAGKAPTPEVEVVEPTPGAGAAASAEPAASPSPVAVNRSRVVIVPQSWLESHPRTYMTYRPTFMVMFDPDPALTRQVEVYHSMVLGKQAVRMYFLVYEDSAEHQKYLSSLKQEKTAFERLIHLKAHLALPIDVPLSATPTDVKPSNGATDGWGISLDSRTRRRAGVGASSASAATQRAVVDVREFRSKLPCMLHLAGVEVVPITLEVGDYVLTPDICVERKSLSDLVGSLNSGRLHSQAKAMTRAYKHAVLLIEFDSERVFSLTSGALPKEVDNSHVMSKLVLLTLHFPTLRVLWARDPQVTVRLFMELKKGMPQPDATAAAAIGLEEDVSGVVADTAVRELLMRLPGVTPFNVRKVLSSDRVRCLADLVSCSKAELMELLGPVNGAKLHDFVKTRHVARP